MTYTTFSVTIADHIAHIELNRPDELNTMVPAFWRELPEAVQKIDREAAARVIVISSTGKHFSAGMDLAVFTNGGLQHDLELGRKHERMRHMVTELQNTFTALENCRIPVLAAIQGGCIGGAVDMTTACDCRYITEEGFFTVYETKIGMTADVGTLQRLPKLIPEGLARELAYTGRRMYAEEAKACGLVNQVFSDQQTMLNEVMNIAKEIAGNSPLAVSGCKEMINYTRDHSTADSLRYMSIWQTGMFQPETDMMETFSAKMEKREPAFADLAEIGPAIKE
ncbi:crotonase/enoyl-CoA hydratase family protein [Pseudoteredinibacter isoporae]|uniref:Enoyl-CoA hydratase n=1 Tax=Pseudoteredinibacter isoporae TaxID=570281 RepID=A0A7X0JXK3_9GAMM|nr:crotonase/enoyl-CoA hydratase family protein [Pseudoteredinibacter isoporae]MBB6523131.1 enoyl-CoA hydratase [Pseudoteredinibacter isoporae]NHO88650.1 crotonase/enoyl-CoA hydratase family protein [Pseudoteredinibacter isoporae]NIB22659.1 crotonase/enoyl-CoA hydratase family protein [Pseudoteredinibacter isoporae]